MRAVGFALLLISAAFGVAAVWIHALPLSGELGSTGGVLFVTGATISRFARKADEKKS